MKIFPLTKVRRMVTGSFLLCGVLGFLSSPASAFPWKEISEIWWTSAAEDHRIEFATSFENGRYIDYRPEYGGQDIYYRVLAETDEMAFIIKRSVDYPLPWAKDKKDRLFFEIGLLCLYPTLPNGSHGTRMLELTQFFEADKPRIFITDPEFFTLSPVAIIARIKAFAGGQYYIHFNEDLTCQAIVDAISRFDNKNQILPGIKHPRNWDRWWLDPYGGPRTPYPRNQFSSLGAIHFVDP